MSYTKFDFERDLFFVIGYFQASIREDNKRRKNKINEERFEQFREYCFRRFSTKNGDIKG